VAGELRDARRAALPVTAAVGGVVTPALVYVLVNALIEDGDTGGWAIPAATDIAFALAVLAVLGRARRARQDRRPRRLLAGDRPRRRRAAQPQARPPGLAAVRPERPPTRTTWCG
jgi:hypothetical protein